MGKVKTNFMFCYDQQTDVEVTVKNSIKCKQSPVYSSGLKVGEPRQMGIKRKSGVSFRLLAWGCTIHRDSQEYNVAFSFLKSAARKDQLLMVVMYKTERLISSLQSVLCCRIVNSVKLPSISKCRYCECNIWDWYGICTPITSHNTLWTAYD